MSWTNPVVWQEGMFLRAQHFQQFGRWTEAQLRARTAALGPFWWGFSDLVVDQKKLETGHFALVSASGVFMDGTPFAIPYDTDNPASLPVEEKSRGTLIYLCVPVPSLDAAQLSHDRNGTGGRYRVEEFSAADTFPGAPDDPAEPAPLLIGRLHLRFMLESDDRRGWQCIPVARVADVGTEHRVSLDDEWIPPVMRAGASSRLVSFINDVRSRLMESSERLAGRLPVLQNNDHLTQLMYLQAANRWLNLVNHFANNTAVHPEVLYATLVQIAGEFGTFAESGRRLNDFPAYIHDDLHVSFTRLMADLRRVVPWNPDSGAIRIDLEQKNNWYRGRIYQRELLRAGSTTFYLVARANGPAEQLRREFPRQVAIGAVTQLQALVAAAIPGIAVSPMPMNPPQLTFQAGAVYFELDRSSSYWEQIRSNAAIGLHVTDMFPQIALELWAVRT